MSGMATTLPVLTFHAIDERRSVISYSPEGFRRAIATLAGRGYRTLRLAEAAAAVRARRSFPERAFVLTFDDGFQSVYTDAFPALEQHGMSATVFLTVGARPTGDRLPAFEGRTMLSWAEIREMHHAGHEFGAHTLTHPDLTRLTPAYPFGRWDARSRAVVQRYFDCACSDALGLLTARSDPHALERVDAYYLRTPRLVQLMTTAFFPWYVRARDVPRRLRRAVRHRLRA
jgi:peptidoglycan/xylan/chitin deacetylase (PgdA/CDA1 family)